VLLAGVPAAAAAQDSQFGIGSLGTPERGESIRARTTGGAFTAFDPTSPLADVALVDLRRLTAYGAAMMSYRDVVLDGDEAAARSMRFPTVTVGGPLVGGFVAGGGHSAYLSRSYRILIPDTVVLRGQPEPFTDEYASEGGVSDLRLALATRLAPALAIGASLHTLTGTTRQTRIRRFEDSVSYVPAVQVEDISFSGVGGAASVLLDPGGGVRLAGWFRADARLEYQSADSSGVYDLPLGGGAALLWAPGSRLALAAAFDWRSWGSTGPNAFDTFAWSVGAELGSRERPLRLGARSGNLPFSPGATAPTEFAVAAGTGFVFAGGRAAIDVGVERLTRRGGGLRETVWTALIGFTVRP
jgi:hypothetical protein